MDVAQSLMIKYGLERAPDDREIKEWARAVAKLISEGELAERAGTLAARERLPGYRTRLFKSEADNIAALLRAVAQK